MVLSGTEEALKSAGPLKPETIQVWLINRAIFSYQICRPEKLGCCWKFLRQAHGNS